MESFDKNGGVFSTLKTDTITVTVPLPEPVCEIDSNKVDALASFFATEPVQVSLDVAKSSLEAVSYSEKFEQIVEALSYDQNLQEACGAIKTQLVS